MNLVFEDVNKQLNLYEEGDKIPGGEDRVCVSPYANRTNIVRDRQFSLHHDQGLVNFGDEKFRINKYHIDEIPEGIKYIIPVGVHEAPGAWAGFQDIKSIFDLINPLYLEHLRIGRAFLLFDSSLEGYHTDRFFDFAHDECKRLRIPVKSVIWVSGNSIIEEQAKKWEERTNKECIRVIGYSHFQYDILDNVDIFNAKRQYIPTWQDQYKYKELNYARIKDFNFLNRKPRGHRVAFFNKLFHSGLLGNGLVSMNKWDDWKDAYIDGWYPDQLELEHSLEYTPMRWNGEDNIQNAQDKINRLNETAMLNSWFSIVSEARYEDSENTVFLSEKTFKPIACCHPFVILGNKHSLKELKKLGYYTFEFLIDESYDELDNLDRLEAIHKIVNDFRHMKNHLEWYSWMRPRLEYNRMVLKFNSMMKPPTGFHMLNELCGTIIETK